MTESHHIGNPPTAPLAPAPTRRWGLYAGVTLAVVALAVGALWVGVTAARNDVEAKANPASFTSPSPSPAAVIPLSEEAACYALVPLIGDALKDVQAVIAKPDGSTVDWTRLDQTISGLQGVEPAAPADMRADIDTHLEPLLRLRGLHEGTSTGQGLELGGYRDAALRLLNRCTQYAH